MSFFFLWPPASSDGHRPTKSGRPSRTDLTSTPSAATHPRRQKHPTGGASAGSGHNPALRGPQSPGNFCATNPAIFPPKGNVDYYGKMRHGNADTSWERTAPAPITVLRTENQRGACAKLKRTAGPDRDLHRQPTLRQSTDLRRNVRACQNLFEVTLWHLQESARRVNDINLAQTFNRSGNSFDRCDR